MSRATRLDISPDSDYMGLSKSDSDRVSLRQVLHQDEQPAKDVHALAALSGLLAYFFLGLALLNAPAIVTAVQHYFGV